MYNSLFVPSNPA